MEDKNDKSLHKAKFVIDYLVSLLDNNEGNKRILYGTNLTVSISDSLFNQSFQKLFNVLFNYNNNNHDDVNNAEDDYTVNNDINIACTNFGSLKFTTIYDKIKQYLHRINNDEINNDNDI